MAEQADGNRQRLGIVSNLSPHSHALGNDDSQGHHVIFRRSGKATCSSFDIDLFFLLLATALKANTNITTSARRFVTTAAMVNAL